MKKCSRCKVSKGLDEFYFIKSRNRYYSHCSDCDRKDHRRRKEINGDGWNDTTKERISRNRDFVIKYLEDKCCIDCGEKDIRVLEFDHVRGVKKSNVSQMIFATRSIAAIQEEIDKCDIRCANCHRKVTLERAGSYKSIYCLNK